MPTSRPWFLNGQSVAREFDNEEIRILADARRRDAAVCNARPGKRRYGSCHLRRLSGAFTCRLCGLLCLDERVVQSEDRLRVRGSGCLRAKRRECEVVVRL